MSYVLFSETERQAKKAHRCIWCGQSIKIGERYFDERSVFDGNIQRHRWHSECRAASIEDFRDEQEEEFFRWENERPEKPVETRSAEIIAEIRAKERAS